MNQPPNKEKIVERAYKSAIGMGWVMAVINAVVAVIAFANPSAASLNMRAIIPTILAVGIGILYINHGNKLKHHQTGLEAQTIVERLFLISIFATILYLLAFPVGLVFFALNILIVIYVFKAKKALANHPPSNDVVEGSVAKDTASKE